MGIEKERAKTFRRHRRSKKSGVTSVSLRRTISMTNVSHQADKKSTSSLVTAFKVISHTSVIDRIFLIVGCIFALINGLCWPLLNYFLATFAQNISRILTRQDMEMTVQRIQNHTCEHNDSISMQNICNLSQEMKNDDFHYPSDNEFSKTILTFAIPAILTGFMELITGYLCVLILNFTSERIVYHMKKLFLKSLLKQDICWFDTRTQGELTSSILRNLALVQTALGEKLGIFLLSISEVTVSLIFCFRAGWKLTLVMSCLYPILITTGKLNVNFQVKMNKLIRVINAELAGLVQEILSSIKTVFAFGGEKVEMKRYLNRLLVTRQMNIKQGIAAGMNFSFVLLITQCFIALGFWYGIKLMKISSNTVLNLHPEYNVRDVLMIVIMILLSGVFIRQAVPLLEVLNTGFVAATDIIAVIDRKPDIDNSGTRGKILQSLTGNIEFHQVHFWFPSSPGEKKILRGINLKIKAGETIALVGPSGGGKSTILQLIQRFYDPQKGKVKVDGTPLSEFNIGWFRQNVGIVSQEPCLFSTTVKENIRYGNKNATHEEIIQAAKEANAHEFIMKLPHQYDTQVGELGGLLSGGQRQRIAIARALVRNPAILLLDEATSALDNESELIVQESLDKARCNRTTVIIAHRLTTIAKADRIVGIKGGRVVEEGTHDELISKEGLYYQLLLAQTGQEKTEASDDEELESSEGQSNDSEIDEDEDDDDVDLDDYLYSLTAHQEKDINQTKAEMRRSFWKILKFCKKDWMIVAGALLFSAVYSLSHPARAFLFGQLTQLVVVKTLQINDNLIIMWPSFYVLVGFLAFVSVSIKMWLQSLAEENLLYRIRQRILQAIFQQEVGWFDEPEQNVANLCATVTVDADNVKKIPGAMICTWVYAGVAVGVMISLGLFYKWNLCLAVGTISIGIFICHYLKGKIDHGMLLNLIKNEDQANNLAVEAVRNFRTVVSLHIQDIICNLYNESLSQPRKLTDKYGQLRAITVAVAGALNFFATAVVLSYGAYLMLHKETSFAAFNMINSMMINNLMEVSHVLAASPSYSKACMSAHKILKLLSRKPLIDTSQSAGIQLPTKLQPRIEFRDVSFYYPSRPTDQILKNINFVVETGQTVAFVGTSGCGKSTAMRLMQRLYDPTNGGISLNGYDIRCVNVASLRSLIGLVSQEPILFNRTIAENIAYGKNGQTVCMHEIIEAAQQANIHEFISSLRQGYETRIGARGMQLSGGQKQRVAIARALIRNPQILLLDEATSALDNESEKVVQESLEKAQEGRTCIVIAHRLSTIQNVDKIIVFCHGQIVEQGSPEELFEKKGMYYEILQIQQGQRRRLSRIIL